MAEYTPPGADIFKEGYKPNTETVILELHRLLAIFLSSRNFAELREGTGETWEPIDHLQQYEEDEVTRILLSIAITARVIDDREKKTLNRISGHCGTLSANTADPDKTKPLSLRTACNKIIHAQKIRYDLAETETRQAYLNPTIYLYGHWQGTAWKATVCVIDFVKQYVSCIRSF